MATKLQDGNTPCLAATPSNPRPTVLVFDSGVGGLSVYDEIRHLLPDLHYIYAFDNVAFPYGEKSEDFIVERVVEIVTAVQQRYPWRWRSSPVIRQVRYRCQPCAQNFSSRLWASFPQ